MPLPRPLTRAPTLVTSHTRPMTNSPPRSPETVQPREGETSEAPFPALVAGEVPGESRASGSPQDPLRAPPSGGPARDPGPREQVSRGSMGSTANTRSTANTISPEDHDEPEQPDHFHLNNIPTPDLPSSNLTTPYPPPLSITTPAPPPLTRDLTELIDPQRLPGQGNVVQSPSGNLLSREEFMNRADRPISMQERQNNIRHDVQSGRSAPTYAVNGVEFRRPHPQAQYFPGAIMEESAEYDVLVRGPPKLPFRKNIRLKIKKARSKMCRLRAQFSRCG
ncbi:hypothetical protein K461DRAFT_1427 [Myriangium duriaei CBS 260.36]|uniref:Uncharacterized protein n=1 Tax=Myriangium duriaei CBS 260.36 TaxID=1168546 RepID=A0A9P4JCR3_9PEZI|nr:hypothetical protein K461DRAFT_1427 [Myriangium duriaei CBS 260.36]